MRKIAAAMLGLGLTFATAVPVAAQQNYTQDEQLEMKIGQQEYQQLQQQGILILNSPYYEILNPLARQIKRVADPQYFHPFRFILVHQAQPNAFAVPGGNVYVTDSLMKFVKNREELGGVLCHETSHDIHHDVLHLFQKQQRSATAFTIGDILANLATGGRAGNVIDTLANVGFTLQTQGYSREVEAAADAKGAMTCAEAGSNPWGMVWLFQQFEKADTGGQMEMLSDHPTDQHRVDNLRREFASNPALFGRYSPNIASATPLAAAPRAPNTQPINAASQRSTKPKGMFPPGSGYKF
jgi:beta-barrel assembly-enhancing protease